MSEAAPLVRVPSRGRFQKLDLAPLGDGGSYFFLSNIIAGEPARRPPGACWW